MTDQLDFGFAKFLIRTKKALAKAEQCACVECLAKFPASDLLDWDEYEDTLEAKVACPKCESIFVISFDQDLFNDTDLSRWNKAYIWG